ncbi:hypothetical protein ITI46_15960 [Streptomyces oryzae]|uniref:Uncharacterized protein n=1 Tax=Streptomyces oryzae TaxID=1434886 RepID=A0ABS3XCP2_9ACTN|nr:hypothetical protein [Streptomyces oryzae]MBO8193151.1 hypothetical protein [Streptomyces oryzae]
MPHTTTPMADLDLDTLIDSLDARVTESELAESSLNADHSQLCTVIICGTAVIC